MSDISKILLPSETTPYNIKDNSGEKSEHLHTRMQLQPVASKKYESTSFYASTASNNDVGSWFFLSVRPDTWDGQWKVKFKVHTFLPTHASYESTTWSTFSGRRDGVIYANWNEQLNTAHYYTATCLLKQAGYNAGYSHALGINIVNATNYTNSGWYRTFEVELLEWEGCTVTLNDSAVLIANWPNYNTTNYNSISVFDAVNRGLRESGDDNTIGSYIGGCKAGPNGIKQYSLIMPISNTLWESCVITSGTGTKTVNSTGFLIDGSEIRVYYYSGSGNPASGSNTGQSNTFSCFSSIDSRYSLNVSSTWSENTRALYLKGTITDGKFYLASPWWADALPSTSDGFYYVYVGRMFDAYRFTLSPIHPIFYCDNNGNAQVYYPPYIDAATVSGHTVEKDIPSDAVFTDEKVKQTATPIMMQTMRFCFPALQTILPEQREYERIIILYSIQLLEKSLQQSL